MSSGWTIADHLVHECPKCGYGIFACMIPQTKAAIRAKKIPKVVWLDRAPDTSGTYVVAPAKTDTVAHFTGDQAKPGQLPGMRASGVATYTLHTDTCTKRGGSRKTT